MGGDEELWYGKVTTTGASTVTFNWSSSVASDSNEYGAQEFSAGLGASTVWAIDKAGSLNGASSTSVPFPSLTPSAAGELYFGYSLVANTAAAGTASGFTYAVTAEANAVAYDTNVSGAVSPVATQSPAGTSSAVGMLLSASTGAPPPPPTVTGVSPATGTTAGGTTVIITGTNFTGASAVKFGTVAATSFTVTNAGSISAVSPAEGAATVDVTVTVGANTSAISEPADQFTFSVSASAHGHRGEPHHRVHRRGHLRHHHRHQLHRGQRREVRHGGGHELHRRPTPRPSPPPRPPRGPPPST